MTQVGSKTVRYAILSVLIFGGVFAALGTLLSVYDGVSAVVSWAPVILTGSLIDQLTHPVVVGLGLGLCVAVWWGGRYVFGSFRAFTVWLVKRLDSVFGWGVFKDPLLVGRIEHQGVAWRFNYWKGGHIEADQRECLLCGLGVVERVLPAETVHGPNTAFNPGEVNRETATDAWTDVFGKENAEDQTEEPALTCPKCNFSVPGTADVLAGVDGAREKFRRHAEKIAKRGELKTYREAARRETNRKPQPADIWDAYVRTTTDPDVLPVDPDQAQRSDPSGAGQSVADQAQRPDQSAAVESGGDAPTNTAQERPEAALDEPEAI